MRIGIDIDDTITNTYDALLKRMGTYFKMDYKVLIDAAFTYEDIVRDKKNFPNYKDFASNNFEDTLIDVPLKKNALETIKKLHNDGHDIIFVTARNKGEYKNPYEYTYDFLTRKNIYFDELHAEIWNKGKFCKENNIDILIDDNVNNCQSAKDHNINTILFVNSFNTGCRRFKTASSWNEIYDIINNI